MTLGPLSGLLKAPLRLRVKENTEAQGLTIVKEAVSDDKAIDIVAVHGLTRSFGSWTWGSKESADGSRSWLEAPFPQDLSEKGFNTRILKFSYNPEALSLQFLVRKVLYRCALKLVQDLHELRHKTNTASRPIVFIAHSLGGLIVKRALIISSDSDQFREMEISTGGLVFFGTPDTNIPAEALESIIRKIARLSPLYKALRHEEDQSLRKDAKWLQEEMEAFNPIMAQMPVITFYEDLKTTFRQRSFQENFVVDKERAQQPSRHHGQSSPMQDPAKLSFHKRHTGLVSFEGRQDRDYDQFMKCLLCDVMDSLALRTNVRWEAYTADKARLEGKRSSLTMTDGLRIASKIPEGPKLLTRRNFAEEINTQLEKDSKSGRVSIVTVAGRAGTGKSTLVRACSYHAADAGRFVFWFNAESQETIKTSYLEFAQHILQCYLERYYPRVEGDGEEEKTEIRTQLGLPDVDELLQAKNISTFESVKSKAAIKAVKDWLLREGNRWLLVYENVDGRPDHSFDLLQYLPLTIHGQIILITAEENRCPWSNWEFIVPSWTEDEAVELLLHRSGIQPHDDLICKSSTNYSDVTSAAKFITRALRTKNLQYDPLAISAVAAQIRKGRPEEALVDYWKGLERQLETIESRLKVESPLGLQILGISAMLSSHAIPAEVFFGGQLSQQPTLEESEKEATDIVSSFVSNNIFQPIPWEELHLHPGSESYQPLLLFQSAKSFVKEKLLSDDVQLAQSAWAACTYCVNAIKKQDNGNYLHEIYSFARLMLPHAKRCYGLSSIMNEKHCATIEWQVLGNLCNSQGAVAEAIGCFKLALKNAKKPFSNERTHTILSLASIYYSRNDLPSCREVLGKVDVHGSWASKDLGLDFRVKFARAVVMSRDERMIHDAVEQFDQLERSQTANAGPTDPKTLLTVQQLAKTLEHLGELERSQALYNRVFKSYRIEYGTSNPVTLDAMEDLARIFQLRGALEEAEALYRDSIEIKSTALGREHPSTSASWGRLAEVCDQKYDFQQADKLYSQACMALERALGHAHPTYVATFENHALSFWIRADYQETEEGVGKAIEEAKRKLERVIEIKEVNRGLYNEASIDGSKKRLQDLQRGLSHDSNGFENWSHGGTASSSIVGH